MSGLAAFIAGMGTGYFQRKDREIDQDRRDRIDQIALDRAAREAKDYEDAQALKKDLGAASEVKVQQETDGLTPDMTGPARPGVNEGFRVGAAKFGTKETAELAAKLQNTDDARYKRVASVYRKHGQEDKAISVEASARTGKLADLQLSEAQLKHADLMSNRALDEEIQKAGGNVFGAAASILTKTNQGDMAGVEVKAVPSKDGKTVDLVGTGQDGTQKVIKSYPNTKQGELDARAEFMKVDPVQRINWLFERAKEEKADGRWQQEFDLNKLKHEDQKQYQNRLLNIQGAQEKRARDLHDLAMKEARVPWAVKEESASLKTQISQIGASLAKAQAENLFAPDSANAKALMQRQEDLARQHRALLETYNKGATPQPTNEPPRFQPGGQQAPAAPAQPSQQKAIPVVPATGANVSAAQQGTQTAAPVAQPAAPKQAVNPAVAVGLKVIQDNPLASKKLAPVVEQYNAAKAALAQAAASNDPKATQAQAVALQQVKTVLEAAVKDTFAGSANDVLNAIYAQ